MKVALLAALVAACGPGLHELNRTPQEVTLDDATSFAQASQAGDVSTVRRILGPTVMNGGIWFADPSCEAEFAVPGEVGGGRLDELARCLTAAKVSVAPRKDTLIDVAILTYAPGIELEARFVDKPTGPWLSWIGYESRRDVADALPTISPDTLESLRTAGLREPRVPELDQEVATSRRKAAYAWVKLCIDGTGNITGVHVREVSSRRASTAFVAAIADWKFRPFAPLGQGIPVCSMIALGRPLATVLANVTLPVAVASDNMVIAPSKLVMTAGSKMIVPDDDTKVVIQKSGASRVVGMFKLCIDETGAVHDLHMLRSTGLPAYDGEILQAIARWRYEPYLDDGKPVPVCSAVTFIYSQR